jgi:hypothetical protein
MELAGIISRTTAVSEEALNSRPVAVLGWLTVVIMIVAALGLFFAS